MNLNQVTLPSVDVERSIAFYVAMGFELLVRSPHYARFLCPEGDATFSVHLVEETVADTGVTVYFELDDVDGKAAALQQRGFKLTKPPTDERWLWREARLQDPDGNVLCLFHGGNHRIDPPWRVKPESSSSDSSDAT